MRSASTASTLLGLARDRFVRVLAVVMALVWLPYFVPILTPDQLAYCSVYVLDLPLLVLVVTAFLVGLGRMENPLERRFWRLFAASWSTWILVRILNLVLSEEVFWSSEYALVHDLLYVGFYLLMALALESRPHLVDRQKEERRPRQIESLSMTVFGFALLVYFFAIPSALGRGGADGWAPSLLLYVVLDIYVLARLLLLRGVCKDPRWRAIYGLLALMLSSFAATDLLEAVLYMEWVGPMSYGGRWDLLWTLPFVFAVLAARVRLLPFAQAAVAEPMGAGLQLFERMRGSPALSCLVALPVIHLSAELSDFLNPDLHVARSVVVLVAVAVLAFLKYQHDRTLREESRLLELEGSAIQERSERSKRMEAIGRLAGGVAHDINNLVHIVGARSDMMLLAEPPGSESWSHAVEIKKAAGRASELSARLKSIERPQAPAPVALELNEAIRTVESTLRSSLGSGVTLSTVLQDRDLFVCLDRTGLERALLNLVINARDAMPDGGEVLLCTSQFEVDGEASRKLGLEPGPHVQLTVTDSGVGVDPKNLARIFDPFFTTKGAGKGTGLGLALVYRFATGAGGSVDVTSEPRAGTTIKLSFPVAPAHESAPEESSVELTPFRGHTPANRAGSRASILVVDDESPVRETVGRQLESMGHEVLRAGDAKQALSVLRQREVDLMLTDVLMPGMRGPELAERGRAIRPSLRVLFMSGHEGPEQGCRPLLRKPFTESELKREVRDSLLQPSRA